MAAWWVGWGGVSNFQNSSPFFCSPLSQLSLLDVHHEDGLHTPLLRWQRRLLWNPRAVPTRRHTGGDGEGVCFRDTVLPRTPSLTAYCVPFSWLFLLRFPSFSLRKDSAAT